MHDITFGNPFNIGKDYSVPCVVIYNHGHAVGRLVNRFYPMALCKWWEVQMYGGGLRKWLSFDLEKAMQKVRAMLASEYDKPDDEWVHEDPYVEPGGVNQTGNRLAMRKEA